MTQSCVPPSGCQMLPCARRAQPAAARNPFLATSGPPAPEAQRLTLAGSLTWRVLEAALLSRHCVSRAMRSSSRDFSFCTAGKQQGKKREGAVSAPAAALLTAKKAVVPPLRG